MSLQSQETPQVSAPRSTKSQSRPILAGRAVQGGKPEWVAIGAMIVFHALAIAAFFFFSWKGLGAALVLYFVAGHVGICMGYHRLLTHRGYKVSRGLEYLLTICGTLALEGGPVAWVGTHRIHHQSADHEGDPHTPRDGKFWAHMGWVISGEPLHSETAKFARYVPDLASDRFYMWLSKYHWVPIVVVALGLLAWGGGRRCCGEFF